MIYFRATHKFGQFDGYFRAKSDEDIFAVIAKYAGYDSVDDFKVDIDGDDVLVNFITADEYIDHLQGVIDDNTASLNNAAENWNDFCEPFLNFILTIPEYVEWMESLGDHDASVKEHGENIIKIIGEIVDDRNRLRRDAK